MRVSAVKRSQHYSADSLVKLDGRAMPFAIEADDEEGWVDVVDIKASQFTRGKPIEEQPRKRLHGSVEIVEA